LTVADSKRVTTWPKHCGCGASFTEEEWEMAYVGVQRSGLADVPDLEMRNCGRCSSTLATWVPTDFVQQ
jgi:hypothetical protein